MFEGWLKNRNTVVHVYDSITDKVKAATRNRKHDYACGWKVKVNNPGFIGEKFDTWQDVVRKSLDTWHEGVKIIGGMLEQLRDEEVPNVLDMKRKRVWSEKGGDEIDLDRVRSGRMDYWRTSKREQVMTTQNVVVLADATTAAGVSSRKILWRGAAAICLADKLEEAGYNVELWCINHSANTYAKSKDAADGSAFFGGRGRVSNLTAWKLKAMGMPVDVASVSAAISGWFYRTIHFQTTNEEGFFVTTWLGRPVNVPDEAIQELEGDNAQAFLLEKVWSHESAVQAVRDILAQFRQQPTGAG